MLRKSIGFINILIVALVAGTVFGIWLGYNPDMLSSASYVEQQQEAIRALNVKMPILGAISILLTIASAIIARSDRSTLFVLIGAIVFLRVAGLVTRFGNQPLNAIVMTWDPQAPPANWMDFRDTWWNWHIIRTLASVIGLCLLLFANPMGRRKD
jgi:uncharacterized membrane protein